MSFLRLGYKKTVASILVSLSLSLSVMLCVCVCMCVSLSLREISCHIVSNPTERPMWQGTDVFSHVSELGAELPLR